MLCTLPVLSRENLAVQVFLCVFHLYYIILFWITDMTYSKHELSTISMFYSRKKKKKNCHITVGLVLTTATFLQRTQGGRCGEVRLYTQIFHFTSIHSFSIVHSELKVNITCNSWIASYPYPHDIINKRFY